MISPDNIHPLKGIALLKAVDAAQMESGLWVPVLGELRYPTSAIVVKGSPSLTPGHLAILEDDGAQVERSYYDVFKVRVRDFKEFLEIMAPIESEPIFVEAVRQYRANPSSENKWLALKDVVSDEIIKFQCSDVEDWSFDDAAYPTYRLEYVPTQMLDLWTGEKFELFYLIDERNILATMELL